MAGAKGRKGKYEVSVKPFFKDIEKWLNGGATEKQCATNLGISYASWNNYKKTYPEFKELCEKPRTELVDDLKGALVKRALGFTYEEKKVYITRDAEGKEKKHTEITTKMALPDTTAIFGALKIYDPQKLDYDIQAQSIDIKRQELELRKLMAEESEWK